MRIEYRGDVPALFLALWVALGAAWVVVRILLDRRQAVRTPSRSAEASGWQPTDFSLTVYERNIFGVRQLGDAVVFGPSGRQIAAGALLPLISVISVGVVAGVDPRPWVMVLTIAGAGAAFVIGLAGFRVRVWVSLADIAFRSRFGRLRRFAWAEVEDVRVEIRPASAELRGSSSAVAIGVMCAAGERPLDLPGFRCIAWVDDDGRDELAVTEAKVKIVRRYRECLVSQWPGG